MNTIILHDHTLTCCDCRTTVTPEQAKTDDLRIYKTQLGLLCELCFENYLERNEY